MNRLHVPGATIIGAMLAVIAFKLMINTPLTLPKHWSFAIQIIVGAAVGMQFSPDMLQQIRHYAIPMLSSALLLILFGGLLAFVFSKFLGIDPDTAFLSTSPGAMTAMAGMATSIDVNLFLVLTFHIVRVILVILLAPTIMRLCHILL